MKMTTDQEARFWAKVFVDLGGGCWHWIGSITTSGYGHFWVAPKNKVAHRVLWEHEKGPIPDGLQLDHLCRNRACVRPDHIEPVTMLENIRRGNGAPAINARKTHCIHGHEYTPENLVWSCGGRACRICKNVTGRAYRARVSAARRAAIVARILSGGASDRA